MNESLTEIYEQYAGKVYGYMRNRVSSRETAEDLTGQTFLNIVRYADRYDCKKGTISVWVWTIARNTLINYYQRSGLKEEGLTEAGTESVLSDFEALYEQVAGIGYQALYQALLKSRSRDRLLIGMVCIEGKSYRQAAYELGWNESTVGSAVARARKRFAPVLRDELDRISTGTM